MIGVLVAQYESARVDEAKEGPLIQVVDLARAPERKSKPKGAIIVMIACFIGVCLGALITFVKRAYLSAATSPLFRAQIVKLRGAWRFRGG